MLQGGEGLVLVSCIVTECALPGVLLRWMVALKVQHQLVFQVDLFPSNSMNDTAWDLSGGGEGKVKGEYHKLMLSLLAKIKSERDS